MISGIYDDRFLVKPTKSACELMPDAHMELPYEGAKEMILVDDVENPELLCNLVESMYEELPASKKKIELVLSEFLFRVYVIVLNMF